MSMYRMVFLGQLLLLSQLVLLLYHSANLYGAAEQAMDISITVAALLITSIIALQMYSNLDVLYHLPGFLAMVGLLAAGVMFYLAIPSFLYLEARMRKTKMGSVLPVRALEDAERSDVEGKRPGKEEVETV
ncbi:hypothetical protein BJX65DRAFT_291703 [Aspergillus insuetus]